MSVPPGLQTSLLPTVRAQPLQCALDWPYTPTRSSLTSPYNRPRWLQPLRQLCAVACLLASDMPSASLNSNVEVREPVGGRGRGLFATRTIEACETIGWYSGVLASLPDVDRALYEGATSGSCLLLTAWRTSELGVDAEPDDAVGQRCLTSYINHSVRRQNTAFEDVQPVGSWLLPTLICVRATRQIKAGKCAQKQAKHGYHMNVSHVLRRF